MTLSLHEVIQFAILVEIQGVLCDAETRSLNIMQINFSDLNARRSYVGGCRTALPSGTKN